MHARTSASPLALAAAALALALAVAAAGAACRQPKPAEDPLLATGPAARPGADDGDGLTFLPAPARKGLLAVANQGPLHFTLLFAGDKVQLPEDQPTNVIVDGQIYQLVVVPAADVAGAEGADGEALLRRHIDWEVGFLSREVGRKLEARVQDHDLPAGAPCLSWSIALPLEDGDSPEEAVRANLFLSTALAGHIVVLGSPVIGAEDPAAVGARLARTMNTLAPSETHLDPAKLREELAAEAAGK